MEVMGSNLVFEDDDDDDVYYAELTRQILQLTADEEEDDDLSWRRRGNGGRIMSWRGGRIEPGGVSLFGGEEESRETVPAWLLKLWRSNGNGTGVFIPNLVTTRRHRQARMSKDKRRSAYKPKGNK